MSHSVLYVLLTIIQQSIPSLLFVLFVLFVLSSFIHHPSLYTFCTFFHHPSSINVYFLYFLYFLPSSVIHHPSVNTFRKNGPKMVEMVKNWLKTVKAVKNGQVWSKMFKIKSFFLTVKNGQ